MTPGRKERVRRRLAIALGPPAWALALFSLGTALYAEALPREPAERSEATDAIVVLTGGTERLDEGLALLHEGLGRKLLISGVLPGNRLDQLFDRPPALDPAVVACCIEMGHTAETTLGNAQETAAWKAREGLTSLRLVTSYYHMPRSLLEFRLALPGARIVPNPVYPNTVRVEQWWRYPGTAKLIATEFAKYLAARARALF